MKIIVAGLLALSVLAGIAAPASADCVVSGWTNSGTDNKPIWKCSDER